MKYGIAEELADHLWKLKRLEGVPFFQGELYVLSQPSLKEVDIPKLAHTLRQKTLPSPQRMGSLLAAREVLRIDGGQLGRWVHRLNLLLNSRDLQKFIDSGVAPLKRYQGEDLSIRLERAEATVEELKAILGGNRTAATALLDEDMVQDSLDALHVIFGNDAVAERNARKLARELDWVPRYLTRVGLIFGVEAARVVLNDAFAGALQMSERDEILSDRIEQFIASVQSWDLDSPTLIRTIAAAFPEAMGDHPNPPSQRSLIRAGRAGKDARSIAAAMGEHWKSTLEDGSDELKKATFLSSLPLHYPGLPLPGMHRLERDQVKGLNTILATVSRKRLEEVWPVIAADPTLLTKRFGPGLLKRSLDAQYIAFVAATPALHNDIYRWNEDERVVKKYLDFLIALDGELLEKLDLSSGWLRRLFESGSDSERTLALTRALRNQESGPVLAARLHALSRVDGKDTPLQRALEMWENIATKPDPQTLEKLENTPQNERLLSEYLHHRSLSGEGDGLSKNLSDLLNCRERLQAERVRRSDEAIERQVISARKRAGNLISRALVELKSKSLSKVLDDATCELIQEITGQALESSELTEELRLALAVAQNEELDSTLFRDFLRAALKQAPPEELAANAAWMKSSGLVAKRLETWAAGFETQVTVGDEEFRVLTERSYFGAAQMGTMVDTCLSLEDGCYAMSALINALDINKHVVYVKRISGERVARKLIGISQSSGLLGYKLYTTDPKWSTSLEFAVDGAIKTFAEQCQLRFVNEGKPAQIHGPKDLWYDDGLVTWTQDIPGTEIFATPPPDWGTSLDAQVEWAFLKAREESDAELLSAVAWRQRRPWAELAACALLKIDAPRALRWIEVNGGYWSPPPALAHVIWFHPGFTAKRRIDLVETSSTDALRGLQFALHDTPLDVALIEEIGKRHLSLYSRLIGAPNTHDFCGFFYNLDVFAALPLKMLLDLISKSCEVRKDFNDRDIMWRLDATYEESILSEQARILRACWVLNPDAKALLKALRAAKHFEIVWVFSHLLRDLDPIPGAENVLKHHLEAFERDPDRERSWSRVVQEAIAAQAGQATMPDWEERLRTSRRAAIRESDTSQALSHLSTIAKIPHPDTSEVIQEIAERFGVQRDRRIDEVYREVKRAMAHARAESLILDPSPLSESEVERLLGMEFARLSTRAQLKLLERAARGKDRLIALKWLAQTQLSYGVSTTLWLCAGDLAAQLTQREASQLGRSVSAHASLIFYARYQVEVMFLWCREQPDMHGTVEDLRSVKVFWDEDHVNDTGPVALLDSIGHSDARLGKLAELYLLSVVKESTALAKLMFAQHILNTYRRPISLPIVEKIMDMVFVPDCEEPLEIDALIGAISPENPWGFSLSLELTRLCVPRISAELRPSVEAAFERRFPGGVWEDSQANPTI